MVQKVCTVGNTTQDTIPASDDFSGTGDNSGSVGDANWDCRWDEESLQGNASIVSSEPVLTNNSGNPTIIQYKNIGLLTGDFECVVDVEMITYLSDNTVSQGFIIELRDTSNNLKATIFNNKNGANNNSQWAIQSSTPSGGSTIETDTYSLDTISLSLIHI